MLMSLNPVRKTHKRKENRTSAGIKVVGYRIREMMPIIQMMLTKIPSQPR
jgi:hypothetical protein